MNCSFMKMGLLEERTKSCPRVDKKLILFTGRSNIVNVFFTEDTLSQFIQKKYDTLLKRISKAKATSVATLKLI